MTMRYTISTSTKTITVETTRDGEVLKDVNEAIKMLAAPAPQPATWEDVQAEAERLTHETDPLEDLSYTDVDPYTLATEELANMVPANYLAAE